jgi:hypothetical protein
MSPPAKATNLWMLALLAAPICQVPLLITAAQRNRDLLNSDGVAYLRFASHYASGRSDLGICGSMGPMLSWLLVPAWKAVHDPLVAARLAMALSALIFLLGTIRVLRSLQLPAPCVVLGAWVTAVATIYWSVMVISPDLLFGGILFFAVSEVVSPRWVQGWRSPILAGALAGLSYLAKPVGFPTSIALVGVSAVLWIASRSGGWGAVLRSIGFTSIGFLLVAGPWVITLSVKYRGLTIYSGSGVAHALVGPPDVFRGYPVTLGRPEPGRFSPGEDCMPEVRNWSPFESRYYAKHQIKVIYANLEKILAFLGGFDRFHLGLAAACFGLLATPWREQLGAGRWRWSGALVASACAIYLPVYAGDFRYYLIAYPFLLAAAAGLVVSLTVKKGGRLSLPGVAGLAVVALSFLANGGNLREALQGLHDPVSAYAADLAGRLRSKGIHGPIAGTGDLTDPWTGEFVGDFVAFLLDEPFYGSDPQPAPEHFRASGAKLILINRQASVVAEMNRDPDFVSLDNALFASQDQADRYPVKVFEQRETGR